jgi:capsid assembly protease
VSDRTEAPGTLLGEIESHVWGMEPRALATLTRAAADGTLGALLEKQRQESEEMRAEAKMLAGALLAGTPVAEVEALRQAGRPKTIKGGIASVSLKGVLAPPSGLLALFFDLESPLVVFERELKTALADPDVGAVLLDVDSPGGVVDGIPEAAAMIRSVRGPKPIVAVANTMAASAAYWLASQADEISVTPSGAVGSIGVYATHRDMSGAMKLRGVETTLVSAGKFKTDGNPWAPLSDEAREHIQEDVDHFYGLFTADVAKGRGVKQADVKAGYGEGRVLNAKAALAANLVERIETLGEAQARLSSRGATAATARAEADSPELTETDAADDAAVAEAEPAGADTRDRDREAVLAALGDEIDPVLASRAFDKIGALANH